MAANIKSAQQLRKNSYSEGLISYCKKLTIAILQECELESHKSSLCCDFYLTEEIMEGYDQETLVECLSTMIQGFGFKVSSNFLRKGRQTGFMTNPNNIKRDCWSVQVQWDDEEYLKNILFGKEQV